MSGKGWRALLCVAQGRIGVGERQVFPNKEVSEGAEEDKGWIASPDGELASETYEMLAEKDHSFLLSHEVYDENVLGINF